MNDKSSTSLLRISKQTKFEEKDSSLPSRSSEEASKKLGYGVPGFKIAHCARRILSVTKDFSKIGSPNSII